MKKTVLKSLAFAAAVLGAALGSATLQAAGLRFNRHFTDNMVFQRDKPVAITGTADREAVVTVEFAGHKQSVTTGDDGAWSVTLPPMPATAEPRTLTATSSLANAPVALANILVGDVILFASQTATDISLGKDEAGRKIAQADSQDPLFRVISIQTIPALKPMSDLAPEATKGWGEVNQQTALAISAPAYHVGRKLVEDLQIPIGIIDLNMGRNFTIGWISREAIAGSDAYFGGETPVAGYLADMEEAVESFTGRKTITDERQRHKMPRENPVSDPRYPAAGYHAVLHPLKGIGLKAILLQLGNDYPYLIYQRMAKEGQLFDRQELEYAWWNNYSLRKDAFRAAPYIIPRVPYQWRENFGDASLPMALIMPPGSALGTYAMHHVQMRELQRKTAAANPHVGLIMPGNESIPFSGQPADAALLASRAASWVLGTVYEREGVTASGPIFDTVEAHYSQARVFFKAGTAEGLTAAPGALDHFEAAGIDDDFLPAKATIDGTTILLESDTVSEITRVRYNWRERPDQGLVNAAGLPAVPFRSDDADYVEFPRATENNLPEEYTTPACDWQSGDVAIVGGGGGTYDNDGFLGATGVKVRPFGPNMLVERVMPGSPADGKIHPGDMIYGVNGTLLDAEPLRMVADAITHAETEAGGGHIAFNLHHEGRNVDVPLHLEVLGTYSATSPYNCPKTDRIVANMEEYLARRGGEASSYAGGGWLHTDTLFLLAAGTPKYQGLVRRAVYDLMSRIDPKTTGMPNGGTWDLAFTSLLLGEYYLATGDRNVLPYQKWYCDALAATQIKEDTYPNTLPGEFGGWKHNYPGSRSYGMLPPVGLPAVIGCRLADEAGVDINRESYDLGTRLFRDGQAEMGMTVYTPRVTPLAAPDPVDPAKMMAGRLSSRNGAKGATAILFNLLGDTRITHLNSLYCAFAYNNCDDGHGNNFFNGFWTPLGAYVHSKEAFINFMRNHHWYQDIKRSWNHGYKACQNDHPGMGPALSMLVPRQRLRILGAPPSVFAKGQKKLLQPALQAYYARDYQKAEQLAAELLEGEVRQEDKVKIDQLIRAAKDIQKSIWLDYDRVLHLARTGKLYEASLDIPQLAEVFPEGDVALGKIERILNAPGSKTAYEADRKRYLDERKSLAFMFDKVDTESSTGKQWRQLTTERDPATDQDKLMDGRETTRWRARIVESLSQAPEGWTGEQFDDSGWDLTSLPISWHLNHTFLGRTTFDVEDFSAIASLRVSAFTFRQQNIEVYINGHLVAKINNCGADKERLYAELTPAAVGYLRNGRNTIAVTTRNDWRWGVYFNIINGGFGLRLEAQSMP